VILLAAVIQEGQGNSDSVIGALVVNDESGGAYFCRRLKLSRMQFTRYEQGN
jgi:hypothetical protein